MLRRSLKSKIMVCRRKGDNSWHQDSQEHFQMFERFFALYTCHVANILASRAITGNLPELHICISPALQSILRRQLCLPDVAIHNELPSPLTSPVITCLVLSRDLSIFSYWVGTLSGLSTRNFTLTWFPQFCEEAKEGREYTVSSVLDRMFIIMNHRWKCQNHWH